MGHPDFLAIGHITQDLLPDKSFVTGGTATFAALTARNQGYRAAVVTAGPPDLRHLPIFENIEIVGPTDQTATIFENIYLPKGRRQFVRAVAPLITAVAVPTGWRQVPVVLIGPVAQECEADLFELFPESLVGLTPQGFMRRWDSQSGLVEPIEWVGADRILPRLGALILSIEDLPAGARGQALLVEYVGLCPVVVCTLGVQGCRLFYQGRIVEVPAYPATEIDPTGAGDVFATAFLLELNATHDPLQAARFANAAASCHIEYPGTTSLPNRAQVLASMSRFSNR